MTDEEWLELVGDAARERKRDDAAVLARMEATEEGRALLAAMGEEGRAKIAAVAFPAARPAGRAKVIALGAGAALAAAAAVVLAVRGAGATGPLPAYEVAIAGPASALRGAPAAGAARAIAIAPSTPLEIVVRPDEDVRGQVVAGAYLVEGGASHAWDVPIEVSEDGAVRIAGETDRLFAGRRGELDVIVIVARPGGLPDAADAPRAIEAHDSARRAVAVHVTIAR
jgi:hypothetical protein